MGTRSKYTFAPGTSVQILHIHMYVKFAQHE